MILMFVLFSWEGCTALPQGYDWKNRDGRMSNGPRGGQVKVHTTRPAWRISWGEDSRVIRILSGDVEAKCSCRTNSSQATCKRIHNGYYPVVVSSVTEPYA